MLKDRIFQIGSMSLHALKAWNTGGEGIHSPRLFYLVRNLFYDTSCLYAWEVIEKRRQAMLRAPKMLQIEDFGTGTNRKELVMHIAQKSVMGRRDAQLLARIVNYMNGDEYAPNCQKPLQIIELGTSLGLTTAYLASVDSKNKVVTFEGSSEIADMARLNWQKLELTNIQLIQGNIDDTLYKYAREIKDSIDFAIMDANHTARATLDYFECLAEHISEDGIVAIDDIRYSWDMYQAWQKIAKHPKVTATMDLGRLGLVFFYPKVQQKMYILRT